MSSLQVKRHSQHLYYTSRKRKGENFTNRKKDRVSKETYIAVKSLGSFTLQEARKEREREKSGR